MANFGFSLSDIVTIGGLAWKTYRACKAAGGEFRDVSQEVLSIHIVIKEIEDETEDPKSMIRRRGKLDALEVLLKGCKRTLRQIDTVLSKYHSLGDKKPRKRDRLRFIQEDLFSARLKIVLHVSALDTFLARINSMALEDIIRRLTSLVKEAKSGDVQSTVLSLAEEPENEAMSDEHWSRFRIEMVTEGFTRNDLDDSRSVIEALAQDLSDGHEDEWAVVDKPSDGPKSPLIVVLESYPTKSAASGENRHANSTPTSMLSSHEAPKRSNGPPLERRDKSTPSFQNNIRGRNDVSSNSENSLRVTTIKNEDDVLASLSSLLGQDSKPAWLQRFMRMNFEDPLARLTLEVKNLRLFIQKQNEFLSNREQWSPAIVSSLQEQSRQAQSGLYTVLNEVYSSFDEILFMDWTIVYLHKREHLNAAESGPLIIREIRTTEFFSALKGSATMALRVFQSRSMVVETNDLRNLMQNEKYNSIPMPAMLIYQILVHLATAFDETVGAGELARAGQ